VETEIFTYTTSACKKDLTVVRVCGYLTTPLQLQSLCGIERGK